MKIKLIRAALIIFSLTLFNLTIVTITAIIKKQKWKEVLIGYMRAEEERYLDLADKGLDAAIETGRTIKHGVKKVVDSESFNYMGATVTGIGLGIGLGGAVAYIIRELMINLTISMRQKRGSSK